MYFEGIDHIGVVVDDLAEASALLGEKLQLAQIASISRDDIRAAFFDCNGTSIEVIEVIHPDAREKRLGNDPARIEHIAFRVTDLDQTRDALAAVGIELSAPLVSGKRRVAMSVDNTTDGVKYQLVEHGFADS